MGVFLYQPHASQHAEYAGRYQDMPGISGCSLSPTTASSLAKHGHLSSTVIDGALSGVAKPPGLGCAITPCLSKGNHKTSLERKLRSAADISYLLLEIKAAVPRLEAASKNTSMMQGDKDTVDLVLVYDK